VHHGFGVPTDDTAPPISRETVENAFRIVDGALSVVFGILCVVEGWNGSRAPAGREAEVEHAGHASVSETFPVDGHHFVLYAFGDQLKEFLGVLVLPGAEKRMRRPYWGGRWVQ